MSSDTSRTAKDAATESLVAGLVYMLTVVGLSVLLARRDWLQRQAMAARRYWTRQGSRWQAEREVQDFRRDISRYEHGG